MEKSEKRLKLERIMLEYIKKKQNDENKNRNDDGGGSTILSHDRWPMRINLSLYVALIVQAKVTYAVVLVGGYPYSINSFYCFRINKPETKDNTQFCVSQLKHTTH